MTGDAQDSQARLQIQPTLDTINDAPGLVTDADLTTKYMYVLWPQGWRSYLLMASSSQLRPPTHPDFVSLSRENRCLLLALPRGGLDK